MKLYKKSDLKFAHGYLVDEDGNSVALPNKVVKQLDALDIVLQEYLYLDNQPRFQPAPTLRGYERKLNQDADRKWKHMDMPATPTIDKKAAETMAFLEEVSAKEDVEAVNFALDKYKELLDFCSEDEFFSPSEFFMHPPINCVSLGNPLELTAQKVIDIITVICIDGKEFGHDE